MMDFNVNLEFSPDFSLPVKDKVDRIVVASCAVHLFSNNRLWSAFDELCYDALNSNDFGLGVLDLEIGLAGYTGSAYPKVYTKCFDLRTDNGLLIKPMKYSNIPHASKVNQRGETIISIRYYFRNEDEISKLCRCERLMFEFYIALDDPKNTYAMMCQLCKQGDTWSAEYANTFRPQYADNIKHLMD